MAIRVVQPKFEFVGGILIPASAGEGKVLTSDASGNGTWQVRPKKLYRTAYTWVWRRGEEVAAETLDGPYISLAAGETQTLVRVDYRIAAGKATLEVKKTAAEIVGFTGMVANVTEPKATTGSKTLSDGSELSLVMSSPEAAKGLRVTITIEHEG